MFLNPLQILGTGVGIEIRGDDLEVALVKSRWKGVTVAGKRTLHDFRRRSPAEWGGEYHLFLKSHGFSDLPATVALPREEVIVRLLNLPAAAGAQLSSAVRFQVDSLHPYGEDRVYFSFAPLERSPSNGRPASAPTGEPAGPAVAVVIAARDVVEAYADLFAEAGVKLRGVTVAAAGYYGTTRLLLRRGRPGRVTPFLLADLRDSVFELYGESEARPFFSAVFAARTMPLEKAAAAAAAELRFPEGEQVPLLLCGEANEASVEGNVCSLPPEQVLGSPLDASSEFDLKRDATAFAIGLAAACPRWGWRINLLPAGRRSSSARWPVAATVATAVITAVVALALWLRGPIQDRRYARQLEGEVKRLEAVEREVRGLERQAEKMRARRRQLETFRQRSEADLALVTEVSRRLPETVWLNLLEVNEDSVQLAGQAASAAPLLGLLDNSGVLTGAAFAGSITRNENREGFRIRAARRAALPLPPAPAGIPASGPAAHPPGGGR